MHKNRRSKILTEAKTSNFYLGSDKNQFKTTNFLDYTSKKSNLNLVRPDNNISHIQISNDRKERFITEFNSKFRSASEEPRASPFKPVPALNLNGSPGTYVTTASKSYKKVESFKPVDESYRLKESTRNNIHKHSFEIGTGLKVSYRSAMNRDYLYEHPTELRPSAKDIKMKYENSPKVNERQVNYATTSLREYKKFIGEKPAKLIKVNEVDSIKYGDAGSELVTMNTVQYKEKKAQDASLSPEKIYSLKSSHLNFGNNPTNFTLSSIQQSPISSRLSIVKKTQPNSSISFGSENGESRSNYASSFVQKTIHLPSSKSITNRSENVSSVNLGVAKVNYITETGAVHKLVMESPARLSPEAEKTLKTHHFTLGHESNDYRSTSSDYGKGKYQYSRLEKLVEKINTNKSNWGFGVQ